MNIANKLALILLSCLAAGCSTYNQRAGYGTASTTADREVISYPAPAAQGAGAAQLMSEADRALAEHVRQQINRYGDLATAASGVQVSAQNGTVTLTGTVPSAEQRKIIDAVAEGTSGVRAVKDRLSLAAPQTVFTQPDSSISSQIRQALKSQPTVAATAPNVQVTENNGVVTLTGTVPTEEDKRLIESVAKNTAGVIGINNNLGVALQPTGRTATVPGEIFNLHVEGLSAPDRTLAQRILDGLRTDTVLASLLPTVNINVASGKISLQGTVQNEQQKRAIVSAVQRAAGVDNVADELQVQPPR